MYGYMQTEFLDILQIFLSNHQSARLHLTKSLFDLQLSLTALPLPQPSGLATCWAPENPPLLANQVLPCAFHQQLYLELPCAFHQQLYLEHALKRP